MANDGWLTKSEVNAFYYNAVGGAIAFVTEAQASFHSAAAARLIACHARTLGKREIRILELGANNGAFAGALLGRLRSLPGGGGSDLTRVDYLAVEYARAALEAAAERESGTGKSRVRWAERRVEGGSLEPAQPTLVALVTSPGRPASHLGLVHAEANQFVRSTDERFDVAILNELLDDMPGRAFYADTAGRRHELLAHAAYEQGLWHVRISARELEDGTGPEMPAASLTARSAESVELVTGIGRLLAPGGMLLVHDYGFSSDFPRLEPYEASPRSVPPCAVVDFPPGREAAFPRSFYRVFGNEDHRVVQITNDVNFAELAAALAPTGQVITLAHGNAIVNHPDFKEFTRGEGVFLSEFGLLEPGDDLPAVLDGLEREQERLRAAYIRDHMAGNENVYSDLVYVKR
jgi:SAM-dependent methyltransferase